MEPINDNSDNNDNAQVEDKILKKKLLLSTFAKECASSSHTVLQQINNAIKNGSKLDATVLSGGYTNYSYKVFIVDKPELVVFAKLCFEFALWNPDKDAHYDLQRTSNEYEIMVTMSKLAPDSIVNPILLSDIEHEGQSMKLLVTEWSCADEQFCNQFVSIVLQLMCLQSVSVFAHIICSTFHIQLMYYNLSSTFCSHHMLNFICMLISSCIQ